MRDALNRAEVLPRSHKRGRTNEIAEVLDLSPATIERDWSFARTWLYDAITGDM
jgi:hypothetical protein